jgi:misacylated tRNA(Ala) deacylase
LGSNVHLFTQEAAMTDPLYHTDSYLQEFAARVVSVDETSRSVVLDRTAFYPGGGGQPCDFGTFSAGASSWLVEKTKKDGEDIQHFIAGSDTLPQAGQELTGKLDWQRRYRLMRTHTAMHILCGVVFRDYGAHVTGGDMDIQQARMDFEFESMSRELVSVIEQAVNREVEKNLPIYVQILPREEALQIPDLIRTKINLLPPGISHIRTVEIVGLDLQADGGTHVHSTAEVGTIRLVDYKSKGKINKRLYVELT